MIVMRHDLEQVARLGATGLAHTGHHEFRVLPGDLALMSGGGVDE